MNSNRMLTYLLYALLIGLICLVGYKACQMKRDQAQSAKENAEFQKTLHDLGYVDEDSTGSQFSGEASTRTDAAPAPTGTTSTVSKTGIEDESPAPTSTPKATTSKATTSKETAAKTSTPPVTKPESKAADNTDLDKENSSSDGRYRVTAGSFTALASARSQMERLIKMGYHDAEVGRFNRGKYAVVIVKRTNSLSEANRIHDQLEHKGIDAAVVDRQRKK